MRRYPIVWACFALVLCAAAPAPASGSVRQGGAQEGLEGLFVSAEDIRDTASSAPHHDSASGETIVPRDSCPWETAEAEQRHDQGQPAGAPLTNALVWTIGVVVAGVTVTSCLLARRRQTGA